MAWGLFPLFFAAAGRTLNEIGMLAAIYPATWGVAQLFTGAWSDRVGRKWLIASGMWVQALGIAVTACSHAFAGFVAGAVLLGLGTAADVRGLSSALWLVAVVTFASGVVAALRMSETAQRGRDDGVAKNLQLPA